MLCVCELPYFQCYVFHENSHATVTYTLRLGKSPVTGSSLFAIAGSIKCVRLRKLSYLAS